MKKTINISLIVGAGAVENAWKPVIRALQPYYDFELNGDSANSIFARMVYLLRWFGSIDDSFSKQQLEIHIEFTKTLKHEISDQLIAAERNGEIKVRSQFKEIIEKFVFVPNNRSIVISTNWDTVVDNAINLLGYSNHPILQGDIKTNHIHGSVSDPLTLYLPSEVTRENYRTKEEEANYGNNHSSIWRALENCNVSILYGLSLSALDAELAQTLACGWDSRNLEKIIIIDPDHYAISKRVKSHLKDPKRIKIYGYDPSQLDNEIDHSE